MLHVRRIEVRGALNVNEGQHAGNCAPEMFEGDMAPPSPQAIRCMWPTAELHGFTAHIAATVRVSTATIDMAIHGSRLRLWFASDELVLVKRLLGDRRVPTRHPCDLR